jgi:hypothetical protein
VDNKRKHKRVQISTKLAYKYADILDFSGNADELKETRYGRCIDLSLSGTQLLTDEFIAPGCVIKLDIELPNEDVPLTTFGKVEWCRKDERTAGVFRTGINFMVIDSDHANLIKRITGEHAS